LPAPDGFRGETALWLMTPTEATLFVTVVRYGRA
jgi:hypothetical protein